MSAPERIWADPESSWRNYSLRPVTDWTEYRRADLTFEWFWRIVDANGPPDLPSDEGEALRLLMGEWWRSKSAPPDQADRPAGVPAPSAAAGFDDAAATPPDSAWQPGDQSVVAPPATHDLKGGDASSPTTKVDQPVASYVAAPDAPVSGASEIDAAVKRAVDTFTQEFEKRITSLPVSEAMRWRPISEAPKDGTPIVVGRRNASFGWIWGTAVWWDRLGVGGWLSRGNGDDVADGLGLAHPTHFLIIEPPVTP